MQSRDTDSSQNIQTSKPFSTTLFIIILFYATLAHVTADIYVPSLPAITKALASTPQMIQLTLSFFMLGFSLSHLVYGPISDRIGRRTPMLFGIGLSVIGSVVCFVAPNINTLLIGRVMQGAGVGACNSVGRSLTRDLVAGNHLAKIGSYMSMIMVFMTAAAPILGGYIQHYFDWRATFLFLSIYTLFIWIFLWKKLPETNKHLNPLATKLGVVIRNYWFVLSNKTFLGYALACSLAYAGVFAYITAAPFLLQTVVGLTPVQYGWLSFLIATSVFISNYFNSKYVMEFGIKKMMGFGIILLIVGGLSMLLFALLGYVNTFVIMLPVFIYCLGLGLTFSNGSAGAIHPFPKVAGSAAALFGCLQILGGALASAIMSKLEFNNQIPLGVVFLGIGCLAFFCLQFLVSKENQN